MRQARPDVDPDAFPGHLVALALEYSAGAHIETHRHARAQLIFGRTGVMTVETSLGSWVLPPTRALWVPARVPHSIRISGLVRMRSIYFDRHLCEPLASGCEVLAVSPLFREVISTVVDRGPTVLAQSTDPGTQPLTALLLELLAEAQREPLDRLHLPRPTDERLSRLTFALRAAPDDRRTLASWGRAVGASERTLNRLFAAELSMSFVEWRRQLRLQRAFELLALGHRVTTVALGVGYDSLSAFIAMFKKATGTTPSSWVGSRAGRSEDLQP